MFIESERGVGVGEQDTGVKDEGVSRPIGLLWCDRQTFSFPKRRTNYKDRIRGYSNGIRATKGRHERIRGSKRPRRHV